MFLFRCDNLVKCLHSTKSVCQLRTISQLFTVSQRRLCHFDVFFEVILVFYNIMCEKYGTFYRKTRTLVVFLTSEFFSNGNLEKILGCEVTALIAGAILRLTPTLRYPVRVAIMLCVVYAPTHRTVWQYVFTFATDVL